jgi:hypothetical protein
VAQLFIVTWLNLAGRGDLPSAVGSFGARMAEPGQLTAAEAAIAEAGPLLTASVDPDRWDEAIAAYGPASGLDRVLPAVMVQGRFMLADTPADSPEARAQASRLAEGCRRLS